MPNRMQLAYCTNVHPGSTFEDLWENLRRHSLAVKARFAPEHPMGVGLWLAAPGAQALATSPQLAQLSAWLAHHQLIPFTLNGFPQGNFHESVVKHRVYHPAWFEPERRDYTLHLIEILQGILPAELEGSISTLPIAWRWPAPTEEQLRAAARHLRDVAERLRCLEAETGRLITICLEPEPGCLLQHSNDVVSFFQQHLLTGNDADACHRYLRVCHDICHAAVMFEDQRDVLTCYAQQGVLIGKVQVSSAVEVDFDLVESPRRQQLIGTLSAFAEDRYLHQTTIQPSADAPVRFFDDLPQAVAAARCDERHLGGRWRVHFHVPIYLDHFDGIGTTRGEIGRCLQACDLHPQLTHFEVETYAWSVLPPALRCQELADGIAREMQWLRDEA